MSPMSVLPEDQENGLANLNDENLAAQPTQPAKNVTIDGSSKYADPEQGEAPAAVASPSAAKRWKRAGHTVVATTPVKKTLAEIVDGGIVKAASGKWEKRRIALHTMLNEPGSSTTAFVISTVITILILASTLCLVLSTESTLLDECNLKIIGPPTLRCTANSSATGQRFPDGCCISRFNWSPFELTFNVAFTIELISVSRRAGTVVSCVINPAPSSDSLVPLLLPSVLRATLLCPSFPPVLDHSTSLHPQHGETHSLTASCTSTCRPFSLST